MIGIMFALYSKAFAKKAVDLNKKDFKDKDSDVKVVAKAKTACGVEYEGTVANKGTKVGKKDKGEFTVKLPVDSKANVTIGANKDGAGSAEVEVQASDAAKVTMKYEKVGTDSAVSGGFEFVDKQFSVETKFKLTDTKEAKAKTLKDPADPESVVTETYKPTGTNGVSVGFAAPIPGVDGAVLGLNPSYGYLFGAKNDKGVYAAPQSFIACPLSVGYSTKEFQLAMSANTVYAPLTAQDPDSYQLGDKSQALLAGWGAKGMFKVSDAINVAFEADQTNFALGKDSFAAFQYGKKDDEDKFSIKGQTSVKLGAEYKVCAATTMKAKVTYTGALNEDPATKVFDFSLKTALGEGKSNIAVGVQMTPGKSTAAGFAYTLE